MRLNFLLVTLIFLRVSVIYSQTNNTLEIDSSWESMAVNYQVPKWLEDGKLGVWFHWGIPSATDENRPLDGSWYGRNMYGGGKKLAKELSAWHIKRYGPLEEFGYEKLIPHFKGENWDPDA